VTTYTCPDGHASTSGDYCDVCGAPIAGDALAPTQPAPTTAPAAAPAAGNALDLGSPPAPGGPATTPPPLPTGRVCPNCGANNLSTALYCEDCGYDFTTGQMPRPLTPPAGVPSAGDTGQTAGDTGQTAGDTGQIGLPTASVATASSGATMAPPITPTSAPGHVEWVAEVWIDPDWYASQDVTDPCPSPGMPLVIPVLERTVLIGRTSTSRNIHPQIDVSADNGVSRRHAQLNSDGQRWWVEDLQSANGTYVGSAGGPLPSTPIPVGQRTELADDDRIYLGAWTRVVVRRATAEESSLGN
jgi:hypothetical protein